jgi:NIPSNAP
MITCYLRYWIASEKAADFEDYARTWMRLIEKYGGTHHGYFLPVEVPPRATLSFPGIGEPGPGNVAFALFSFSTLDAYETYRQNVANDPECLAVTKRFEETKCFTKYERVFVRTLER